MDGYLCTVCHDVFYDDRTDTSGGVGQMDFGYNTAVGDPSGKKTVSGCHEGNGTGGEGPVC